MKLLRVKLATLILTLALIIPSLSSCSSSKAYDYDLKEYILIGAYSEITVSEETITELFEEYKSVFIRSNSKKLEITDRLIRTGDIVNIDYDCYLENASEDDEPLISDTGCDIILGEGKYFIEIESALTDIAPIGGTKTDVHIRIPDDFGLSLMAGKNVVYHITLNAAYEEILPEYDTQLITERTSFSSIEQYEEAIYKQVYYQAIWDELVKRSDVLSYPHNEVNEKTVNFIEYYTNLATAQGITLEEYIAKKFFIEITDFHLQADEYAKELVKEEMIVYGLSRNYSLEISDDEYQSSAAEYADYYGCESVAELEALYGKSIIKYTLLKDKVMKYVVEKSAMKSL